ncbi:MAG TPA: alpha/beta fold hydrolase [Solirubrobacteraceae bacterium]|jgi:pimeloyl-ACP methyl ester carboxylesterase|nr:alpha/beta fold hydrolase [Solirubrobacteraceae bacterium]
MRRLAISPLLAALLLVGWPASSLGSPPEFGPCPNGAEPAFACATVTVPLDRGGQVPGTVPLKVERKLAGFIPSKNAVVALAGGPGQSALELGEFIAKAIAPALGSRDLLVFDQRGTGESGPLSCPALSSQSELERTHSIGELVGRCAQQLGPARGDYTSQESVADIEALRQAGGYEKLVLYGTSYGTKVALEYAERYPQHVEALVLDSVVPTSGPEAFAVGTFQAIGGALGELCSNRACAGITSNPLADLARLTAQLRKHALSGSVYDGSGHRHAVRLSETSLLGILQAGDLNPALRALLPAAVISALRRDPDPLLRLELLSEGLIPNVPGKRPVESSESIDETLFVDTSCEELPFPWQRAAPAPTRLAEALASLRGLPSADFYPFDASTALSASLVPVCASWPDASPPPPAQAPLPGVPTLILSGAQDLRTPTANARGVAALIPGSQLLVVPFTGHSVLGSDFSGCAEQAVGAFFAGTQVQPCGSTPNIFSPTPVTPTKLAYIHSPSVLPGRPGQTLTAVLDTILDLNRQVIGATLQANAELPIGSSFGGLRGGYARLETSKVVLHDLSFVAGVRLSGVFPVKEGQLQTATIRISGSAASPGTVRIGAGKTVSGTLGGRRFDVNIAKVKLARTAAGGGEWPTGRVAFPLPGLARVR